MKPFIRFVRTINNFIIFFAGLLLLTWLMFILAYQGWERFFNRQVTQVTNIETQEINSQHWYLGSMQVLPYQNIALLPAYVNQNYQYQYSSKSAESERNHFFINMETYENYWLLPNHNQLIYYYYFIEEDKALFAILYQIIQKDTNNDNKLSSSDNINIVIADKQGKKVTTLAENIEDIYGYKVIDKSKLFISYQSNGQLYTITVSLEDFSIIEQKSLEIFKK